MNKTIEKWITYGLYPILLAITLGTAFLAIRFQWDFKLVYVAVTVFLLIVLIAMETIFPLRKEWSMTKKSFWRDIRYILMDAPTIGLSKAAFGMLAIYISEQYAGYFSATNAWLSALIFLVVFEFFQYWYHRFSHTGKGPIGRFLWKVHVAHHLPDKVYVIMHAVFNPINALLTVIIIQGPMILLGISPAAILIATLMLDLQGLVSHFNVNIRAGWLNYIFIGTESHRNHHSANMEEAQNYGTTLAIWDIIFGTFYYKPGKVPERLGIEQPEHYPQSGEVLKVISLPFQK